MPISPEQKSIVREMMFKAVRESDRDRFDLCVKKGADINDTNALGQTPLMVAIEARDENFIRKLIESGAELLKKDASGNTAFDYAKAMTETNDFAIDRKKRVMDVLLKALPDATSASVAEKTPAAVTDKPISIMKPVVIKKKPASGGFKL